MSVTKITHLNLRIPVCPSNEVNVKVIVAMICDPVILVIKAHHHIAL